MPISYFLKNSGQSLSHWALASCAVCMLTMPAQAQSQSNAAPNRQQVGNAQGGFAKQVTVGGSALQLNGSGIRYKAIFKVYNMALYTSSKVASAEEAIALRGSKRLDFVALRELPGTDLGVLFLRGMKDNSPIEQINKHLASSNRLIEIFSGRSKLMPGDTFSMDYSPGKGTTFYIQGVAQGASVGDDEFFAMVLKIWLGPIPADHKLKDALLGTAA